MSVTEGPPRVRGCYPQDLAVGPGLFSAAGPTSHATAPLCTPYPEFPGHLGPLPTAPPRTLTHRPLRCVASFFFPFLRCPGPLPRIPFAVQFWYLQAPGWRALLIMTLPLIETCYPHPVLQVPDHQPPRWTALVRELDFFSSPQGTSHAHSSLLRTPRLCLETLVQSLFP